METKVWKQVEKIIQQRKNPKKNLFFKLFKMISIPFIIIIALFIIIIVLLINNIILKSELDKYKSNEIEQELLNNKY